MSNTLVTASAGLIAREALAVLKNNLVFGSFANRDFQDEYMGAKNAGYMPGATVNIKKPPRYQYRAGRIANPQATTESTIPLTLSQGGCDMSFTSFERTLSLSRFQDKVGAAMASVVNEIDRQGLDLAHYTAYNAVGTVGTLPNTQASALSLITSANQRLDEMAAPRDRRRALVMNPAMNGALVVGLAGLFNSQSKLSAQYGSGMMVDSLGLEVGMDQNVATHTNGTQPTTGGTVNGAGQTGSLINVNSGTITGTITRGSKITFANVFAVNPQSRQSTGALAQFTLTADAASGATQISIAPAITPTGAFQNVTSSPANAAGITVLGAASATYGASVAFHKDAFTLAMVPMWKPSPDMGAKVATASEDGYSVKVTESYDVIGDAQIVRIDVLFGWAAPYPELATLVVA